MTPDPVEAAHRWAEQLPPEFAHRLAAALRDGEGALQFLGRSAVLPESAAAVRQARELSAGGSGPFAGGALEALLDQQAQQAVVTPVWTGPEAANGGGRLTIAVLADLIGEAEQEILLVSFATQPSEEIRAALAAAADRGVRIAILLERTDDNPQFNGRSDPFPGIPATRLAWPSARRPPGASMHAKVLVVDRETALVGSANLTGYGLERNLECGLLVRGGPVPATLADHLLMMDGLEEL